MFVSSFNTYISTTQPQKIQKESALKVKSTNESFSKYINSPIIESKNTKNLPISYISNYKAFNNKQKLEDLVKNPNGETFSKISTLQNMKTAYSDNSKVFSLYLEPKQTLSQTPKTDTALSPDMQQLSEITLRKSMLSTYISNNNYYLITA